MTAMTLYTFIMIIVAWKINTSLILRWKILLKGKFFWLRSAGSFLIADAVISLFLIPTWFSTSGINLKQVLNLDLVEFFTRLLFIIILAFPSTVIVILLRIIERKFDSD